MKALETGVSVVIPLYNKEETVLRAIDSVLAQERARFELIVVDDGSTDQSPALVKQHYADKVVCIQQKNAGPSAARNTGVRQAKYKLVTFLDADDEYLPGCLFEHLQAHAVAEEIRFSLVSYLDAGERLVEHDLTTRLPAKFSHDQFAVYDEFAECFVINVPSGAFCLDKTLYWELGGYDEGLRCWEISEFMLRALCQAGRYVVSSRSLLKINRISDNSGFGSARQNPEYMRIYAEKIADRADAVGQSPALVKIIKEALVLLYQHQRFDDFKSLIRYTRHMKSADWGHQKLKMLANLPVWLLEALSQTEPEKSR